MPNYFVKYSPENKIIIVENNGSDFPEILYDTYSEHSNVWKDFYHETELTKGFKIEHDKDFTFNEIFLNENTSYLIACPKTIFPKKVS